ncbi:uncharacterized protein METZ01_LOCUS362934, partial [marine metagenome]
VGRRCRKRPPARMRFFRELTGFGAA